MSRPLAVGDVVHLAEDDYCYGVGLLRLRVTEILGGVRHRDDTWIEVRGIPLLWNGAEGEERYAALRLSALARAGRTIGQAYEEAGSHRTRQR